MNFVPSVKIESLLTQDVINWDDVAQELMDEREKQQLDTFLHQTSSWTVAIEDFNPAVFLKKTKDFLKEIGIVNAVLVVALPIIAGFSVMFWLATYSGLFISIALSSVCLISSSIIARNIEESNRSQQAKDKVNEVMLSVNDKFNHYCIFSHRGVNFMLADIVDGRAQWKTSYNRTKAEKKKADVDFVHEFLAELPALIHANTHSHTSLSG
ncbi:MAG: hypothetical protein HW387_757 [Parachlamydiales bacterium]|nr:hypothetical protein [Parachlamydiales bacterium]